AVPHPLRLHRKGWESKPSALNAFRAQHPPSSPPSNQSIESSRSLFVPRARTFLVLLLMLPGILSAMPVQYKIDQMLKQAEQQRHHQYVPARAGWNGSEEPLANVAANPAYQKLLYESSPAAIRSWLRKAAWPHWSIP